MIIFLKEKNDKFKNIDKEEKKHSPNSGAGQV